jgi:hypothetical protein
MSVNYIKATPADIGRIVDRIENVVEGEQNTHVSIACIIVAILAQKPESEGEELAELVKGVSEYMAAAMVSNEVKH